MVRGSGGGYGALKRWPAELRDARLLFTFGVLCCFTVLFPYDAATRRVEWSSQTPHAEGISGDAEHGDEDEFVADWLAEVTDPDTGNIKEIRGVLKRGGVHHLTPFNFRSVIVHSVIELKMRLVVLLYKPESELCLEVAPHWWHLGGVVDAGLQPSSGLSAVPLMLGSFRVNAFADQEELDSGALSGSGGDGADVIRESGGAELLDDVPAVVMFVPDASSKTGARMRKWTGPLTAATAIRAAAYDAGLRLPEIDVWLHEHHPVPDDENDDDDPTFVGNFRAGVMDWGE